MSSQKTRDDKAWNLMRSAVTRMFVYNHWRHSAAAADDNDDDDDELDDVVSGFKSRDTAAGTPCCPAVLSQSVGAWSVWLGLVCGDHGRRCADGIQIELTRSVVDGHRQFPVERWSQCSNGFSQTPNSRARSQHQQELSYRKQIARQLRTQYVDGIYRSNYPWPWNLDQGSLKVTGNGTIE